MTKFQIVALSHSACLSEKGPDRATFVQFENPLTSESSESATSACGHNKNNPPFDFTGGIRKATVWASSKKFQDTEEKTKTFAKAAAARQ